MTDSFARFQATRRKVTKFPDHYRDGETTAGGMLYLGRLCIEDTETWAPTVMGKGVLTRSDKGRTVGRYGGRWYLMLGNAEYLDDDLSKLEGLLYEYAVAEGFTDTPDLRQTLETLVSAAHDALDVLNGAAGVDAVATSEQSERSRVDLAAAVAEAEAALRK